MRPATVYDPEAFRRARAILKADIMDADDITSEFAKPCWRLSALYKAAEARGPNLELEKAVNGE